MRLKVAVWLIGATAVLYGATDVAWQMGLDPKALFEWSDRTYALIEPIRWYLALARVTVMVLMWWFWPELVSRWFPESLLGHTHKRALWMALRHKVVFMVLCVEVCIHVSYWGSGGRWA